MTLKRHILRKHADKACWSYLCLYCGQRFMEPTRYQSHIKSALNYKIESYLNNMKIDSMSGLNIRVARVLSSVTPATLVV